jgi:hypothetical protein
MGDSKTFNYPKSNSNHTNSGSHESSRVAPRKPTPNQAQNFEGTGGKGK